MALKGEAKREWRRKNAEAIRAYHLAWVERRKLIDPEFAAKEKLKEDRREELRKKKEAAEAAREARRIERESRPRLTHSERMLLDPDYAERVRQRRRRSRASKAARERAQQRRRERMATDQAYAENLRERDRKRYAEDDRRRIEKIKRQSRRRMDREFMRLGELENHRPKTKPCKLCGKPVVGRPMIAKYCGEACAMSAARLMTKKKQTREQNHQAYLRKKARREADVLMPPVFCPNCKLLVSQTETRRPRKYCSIKCRTTHYGRPDGKWSRVEWRFRKRIQRLKAEGSHCPSCSKLVLRKRRAGERPKYCSLRCGFNHVARKRKCK